MVEHAGRQRKPFANGIAKPKKPVAHKEQRFLRDKAKQAEFVEKLVQFKMHEINRLQGNNYTGTDHQVANELLHRVLLLGTQVGVVSDQNKAGIGRRTGKFCVYGKQYTVSLALHTAKTDEAQPPQVASLASEYADLTFAEVVDKFQALHGTGIYTETVRNATRVANEKRRLHGVERLDYALRNPREDNYMTQARVLADAYKIVRWKPVIDLCCSVLGSNAVAPFYYSPLTNALKQLS